MEAANLATAIEVVMKKSLFIYFTGSDILLMDTV